MMRGVEARLWGPLGFGLLIAASMVVAFAFGAWVWNPVNTVEDVAEEAGRVVDDVAGTNFVFEQCPNGWDDVSAKDIDVRTLSCQRTATVQGQRVTYLVVLNPDNTFNHCTPIDVPGAEHIYNPKECPGWPS